MRALPVAAIIAAAAALAGCGGAAGEPTAIYLKARLGPDGPSGQRAPVLARIERDSRDGISRARQAVLELLVGPSPGERGRGFLDTLSLETRLLDVRVRNQTAIVELAGKPPDFYGAAAIVYSVTEVPGIARIGLRVGGKPCCVQAHGGGAISWLTRDTFRGWQGEPCDVRTEPTQVRCRGA